MTTQLAFLKPISILSLTRLNEQFQGIRSQILLIESLPSLNRTFTMVIQQERQVLYGIVDESKSLTNVMETKKGNGYGQGRGFGYKQKGRGYKNSDKVCTYCSKLGHTIASCYRKHGYPPSFGRGSSYTNQLESEETKDSTKKISQVKEENDASWMAFTTDQFIGLLALLQQNTLKGSNKGCAVKKIHKHL
uniref:Retrovirus-related Pol polyprotein from transposon TNT 1-94 n=1 Tax=Cajanus cajan TaxID=3821 RepID=A0A151QZ92_CAJCA|nr:hypothetical protein KK1_043266 [Cajanus cajan]